MNLSDQAKEVAANHFLSYYPQATGAAAYDTFMDGMDATEGMLIWQSYEDADYDKLRELMDDLATDVQGAMDRATHSIVVQLRGGVVQCVLSTAANATVKILDYDEIADCTPEVAEFERNVAAGTLHFIY